MTGAPSRPAPTTVLFDLDGTLVHTRPAVVQSYRYAFATVLGEEYPSTPEEVIEALSVRFLELCQRKAGARAEELVAAFRHRYLGPADALAHPPAAYAGVAAMFVGLAERRIAMGLVTNKTRVAAEHELRRCHLDHVPFRCFITAEDAVRGKPDPAPLLIALRALDRQPAATAYLGDAPHDITAAHRAGLVGIGAAYGDWGRQALDTAGAEILIHTPLGLLDILDSWNTPSRQR